MRAQLRALRRAALRVASHPLEHLHPFVRRVRAARHALERVALRAVEQAVLHRGRARPAQEPLAVGQLRREVPRRAQLQIELTGPSGSDVGAGRPLEVVARRADANRVRARLEAAGRKGIAPLRVADDRDRHRRSEAADAHEHAFHRTVGLRRDDARQGSSGLRRGVAGHRADQPCE